MIEEKQLIFNSCFYLENIMLEIGLNSVQHFKPSIRMFNHSNEWLPFDVGEWNNLINRIPDLFEEEQGDSPSYSSIIEVEENFTIYRVYHGINITKNNKNFFIFAHDVYELLRLCILLEKKIEFLNKIEFYQFYKNILQSAHLMCSYNGMSILEIIKYICNSFNNIESSCLIEYMYYFPNEILNEFNKNYKKYYVLFLYIYISPNLSK